MDHLAEIIYRQRKLQESGYGHDYAAMTPSERQAYIEKMYIATIAELGEAINETPWKPWSSDDKLHSDRFMSEIVDSLQFILNMLFAIAPYAHSVQLAAAMNDTHARKVRINYDRINASYNGMNKCAQCKRALDDPHTTCTLEGCAPTA